MSKKDVKFDAAKANQLSERLKAKIVEMQEEVDVIDEMAEAKAISLELASTNDSLERHIKKNKGILAKEEEKVKTIKDTIVTEQALADQNIDEIKSGNADRIKLANIEVNNRIKVARDKATKAEEDSDDRIKGANKNAKEAEALAVDAESRKLQAIADFEAYKEKTLA